RYVSVKIRACVALEPLAHVGTGAWRPHRHSGRRGIHMSGFNGSRALAAALSTVAMLAVATPALAQRQSVQERRQEQVAQIPVCAQPLGAISVIEPEDGVHWWSGQQLPAPSRLIKVFVNKSRCFTLVDRGAGLGAAMRERD